MIDYKEIQGSRDKLIACHSLLEQLRVLHNEQIIRVKEYPSKLAGYRKVFREHQAPLLVEVINLRRLLRRSIVPDIEWHALPFERQEQILDGINELKLDGKSHITPAVSSDLEFMKALKFEDLPNIEIRDPAEDFTSANWNNGSPQADPDSDITVAAAQVTIDTMARDIDAYFYRTHTISGDFEWLVEVGNAGGDGSSAIGVVLGSDSIGDLTTGDVLGMMIYNYTSTAERLYVLDMTGGSYNDSDYSLLEGDPTQVRYVTMDRTNTTLTALLYTDAARTNLDDTIACSCKSEDKPYIYACASRNTGTSAEQSGYVKDWDLQEAPAPPTYRPRYMGVI